MRWLLCLGSCGKKRKTFKVVDGKLYLFFNGDLEGKPFNTLNEWNKDEKKQLKNINTSWTKLKKA